MANSDIPLFWKHLYDVFGDGGFNGEGITMIIIVLFVHRFLCCRDNVFKAATVGFPTLTSIRPVLPLFTRAAIK